MNDNKNDEHLLRQRIAMNLAYYRKLNNMTQSELAERISYSDKSISKWERAEGVPDIYVLALLADLFGITVNEFLSEPDSGCQPVAYKKNLPRFIILLLSVGLVWLVATIVFCALRLFLPSFGQAWLAFIFAIPVSFVICVVFSSLWWSLPVRFVTVSLLIWSIALCIHIFIPITSITLIYIVAAVLEVLTLLWFLFIKSGGLSGPPRGR